MGFDVTYHPMTAAEMGEWLFSRLAEARAGDQGPARKIARAAGLGEAERDEGWLRVVAQAAAWSDPDAAFEPTYGYALAAAQTFFARHWYTRGASFTHLAGRSPRFERYLAPLPAAEAPCFPENPSDPRLRANWQSGAWMPPGSVAALLDDLASDPGARGEFEACFPGGQAEVVSDALRSAAEAGRGVLEASDVVEPNPLDLGSTASAGSLRTLDLQGLLLYRETAVAQLKAAGVLQ